MSEISAGLTLRVIVNGSMGVASTSSFDDEEIARTAELAREAAKHSDPLQNFSGLYQDHEPVPQLATFDHVCPSGWPSLARGTWLCRVTVRLRSDARAAKTA